MSVASISPEDFLVVRSLLRRHAALVLEDGKEYLVEARLGTLAHREGMKSLGDLLLRLRGNPPADLCQKVVEAMTIHETSFFRDWRPFEQLRKEILPKLIAARATVRELSIWSAACSTGQEPYSLAMLLCEHFPQVASWRVKIFATDISHDVLDRAAKGRYNQLEINRGLPANMLLKYFERQGLDFVANEALRRMIDFRPLNLASTLLPLPPMDLVFMRNVLIYFSAETKRQIFGRVAGILRNDGYLFMGTGETTLNLSTAFERAPIDGAGCYRLVGARGGS